MKQFILIIFASITMTAAQDTTQVQDTMQKAVKEFVQSDVFPQFPGGKEAMAYFLNKNLVYPSAARKQKIQGTTKCTFVIEKDGSVTNVTIKESSGNELLDQEAVRVISKMPKWMPGFKDGKAVRVKFDMPAHFKL